MDTRRLPFALALAATLLPLDALARKCPNILFVVDRSGSMLQDPRGAGGHPTKWELTTAAIQQTLDTYGGQLPFGLELFSTANGGAFYCYNDTKVQVPVAHDTKALIMQTINLNPPSNGAQFTNTGDAIKRAYIDGNLQDKVRRDVIVLITDGMPNCSASEPSKTITEIQNAAAMNPSIHTFVVAFDGSGGVNPTTLNQMAKAGLEPVPGCDGMANPCYYSASNQQKFNDAVAAILGALSGNSTGGSCDDTCFSETCPAGQICGIPAGKIAPQCMVNRCMNQPCDAMTYCSPKDGQCYPACMPCGTGQKCIQGSCQADPCDGKTCGPGQVCDPMNGCVADKCALNRIICPPSTPLYCDQITGNCVDDPCRLVNCPPGATCYDGYCMIEPISVPPDMAATDDWMVRVDLARGQRPPPPPPPGCSVGGGATTASGALLLAFALGSVIVRRRRRSPR